MKALGRGQARDPGKAAAAAVRGFRRRGGRGAARRSAGAGRRELLLQAAGDRCCGGPSRAATSASCEFIHLNALKRQSTTGDWRDDAALSGTGRAVRGRHPLDQPALESRADGASRPGRARRQPDGPRSQHPRHAGVRRRPRRDARVFVGNPRPAERRPLVVLLRHGRRRCGSKPTACSACRPGAGGGFSCRAWAIC